MAVLLAWLAWAPAALAASPPVIAVWPVVAPDPVVADDTTPCTVTMTASDADGFNDLRCLRVLFDYTEAQGQSSLGRGYLAWGLSDGDITQYGGAWVLADATGGGRWGYLTDNWGGTTYITPVACEMSTGGSATGAEGSRTVMWTFTAKPAWARNPFMNDADCWVADYSGSTGWRDSPGFFDVVAGECAAWADVPRAPIVSNPTPTSLDVSIDPADSALDSFVIMVSLATDGTSYLQADGTMVYAPVWRTRAEWGTVTVTGLPWNTSYSFSARAWRDISGMCGSAFGPAAAGQTDQEVPLIDFMQGTPFSPGVRGQCPYRQITTSGIETVWDLSIGSSGRGLAGGLDADTYDWRDVNSGANWGLGGGYFTTLQFLQFARDHGAWPVLTANMFGGGYKDPVDGTFVCQTDHPEGLAADWVRYTNSIVQNYRQGDEGLLAGEDLRVYDSIADWLGRPKLTAPGETATPIVQYWEIGNEPEVPGIGTFLRDHYLGPADYRDRYKLMSQAMLAVDPALKIGPCLINPADSAGSGQWLSALAADPTIPIDFVAYHPYYSLKNWWNDPPGMRDALRGFKSYLAGRTNGIRTIMSQHGRTDYELMATEWNPMNWDATSAQQRSVAQGLGVVEAVFTFAEKDLLAAHFWEQPQSKLAVRDVFHALVDHMGDVLLGNLQLMGLDPGNTNWRIYATKHSGDDNRLMIWGLNFDEDEDVSVELELAPCIISSAVVKRYGMPGDDAFGGDTSLMHDSGMAWTQEDVTGSLDSRRFTLSMADAEVTLLVLDVVRVPQADFDRDGDVDQSDFGSFQACLSGMAVSQTDPACRDAKLDNDEDVDQHDFTLFFRCMSGPDVTADPDCAG